ncbi:MarR family winged helix-turn-helix transcriptional regulator [Rhizobium halophytocola]|uniref:DNA-binding MarR family transcriptional regulator n=1 Tax=Rhizobium halophytocola TaxID=735519 RepID=A0ABS4DUQ3_9HYPH|nr:MarR family transcriptional regulator [Rhizobium halophytocola]MBP1849414.1 DNA-binding MarR family transcriptional regulator [Rhizobium halophytocola]
MRKILRTTELNGKQVMSTTGLTPSQLIFMHILDEEREQTAGHVAARMGITQATATVLLQKLEALGMISRRKGEHDRRQVWLSLTKAGQDALAIAPDGVHARFHEQFRNLEDWEQAMLIASLERVAAMLGNHDDDVAAVLDSTAVVSDD